MSQVIVFRLVYSTEDVPKIQYLTLVDSLFPDMGRWEWKESKNFCFHFNNKYEAEQQMARVGDRHAIAVPVNHIKPKEEHNKKFISPSEVYRNTCKRLGEHED